MFQRKKNDGKMQDDVKLIIVSCNFTLPEKKLSWLCQKKNFIPTTATTEFHSQALVCVINLT